MVHQRVAALAPGRHAHDVPKAPDHEPRGDVPVVGWREWALLPALTASSPIKVKIDTGATTSAIHVEELELHDAADGQAFASFELNLTDDPQHHVAIEQHPVIAYRFVKSSSGHGSYRPVIRTELQMGLSVFDIDITLTGRDQMGFKMLIGRAALRGRFHVDPSGSFLQGNATAPSSKQES